MTLPRFAYFRGEIRPYAEAQVGLLTHALNYGTGVFGGLRAYWNAREQELFAFRPRDHFERLCDSARILRMELPADPGSLVAELLALLRAEGLERDAYIRALAFYGDQNLGVRLHGLTPELALVALPATRYIEKADGAHVTFSSWVRIDDNVIPPRGKIAGGYVNSALAKSDAELAGFDEALMLNRSGQLSEGSAENVFLVRRGRVVTPPLTGSILEGITRRSLIELMRGELGLEVDERPVDRSEVYLAEEVFLAGTAVQVVPVTRVDHRPIGAGKVGPVTRRIEELYDAVLRGSVPARRAWCEPVYARGGEVRCA